MWPRLWLVALLPALAGYGAVCEVVSAGSGDAGPAFAPGQPTGVMGARGAGVALHCRVLRLGDNTVSWVRSRDLQILSHAGAVFTADSRVTADVTGGGGEGEPSRVHTLRIERLRAADAGSYECQVNTEPKMSLFFNLSVLDSPVPRAVVSLSSEPGERKERSAGGEREVWTERGRAVTLRCEARYSPAPPPTLSLPPLDLHWLKDGLRIDLQRPRGVGEGGVALETERWAGGATSRLTLGAGGSVGGDGSGDAEHAGRYTCAARDAADSLTLRVLQPSSHHSGEVMEAMQRDQSTPGCAGAGRGGAAALLAPALAMLLSRCLA